MSKTVKGIWVFNEVITIFEDQEQVEFTVLGLDLTQYNYREKFEAFSNAIYSGDYDSNNLIYIAVRNDASGTFAKITAYNNPESKWNTYGNCSLRFVNFGEEEQSVSDDFYDWLMNNTIVKGASMSDGVNIIYGNEAVASIKNQQIAVLNCKGEKMTGEIIVTSPKSVEQLPSQEKAIEITSNGTYPIVPDDGYVLSKATAVVNVPEPILISKTITKNGTYKASEESADELQGMWVFNADTVTIPASSNSPVTYNVNFTTLDGIYTADCIRLVNTGEPYYTSLAYELHFCGGNLGDQTVYKARYSDANGLWLAEHWQTIIVTSTLAEVTNGSALLAWLQVNATKMSIDGYSELTVNVASEQVEEWDGSGVVIEEIASASLITFTIDGTSYQAEEGMTWAEWVESDYNTDGYWCDADSVSAVWTEATDYRVKNSSDDVVYSTDTIIADHSYVHGSLSDNDGSSGGAD